MKIENCNKCEDLIKSRNCIVNGYGTCENRIMFVGEAPGQKGANISGEPFSHGRSGTFFSSILKEIGIGKEDSYTTNVVKCSPPENRKPTEREIDNCLTYLYKEIIEMNPKIIVTLGSVAKKYVNVNNTRCKIVHLFHPAYILRVGTPEIIKEYKRKIMEVKKMSYTRQLKPEEYSSDRKEAIEELKAKGQKVLEPTTEQRKPRSHISVEDKLKAVTAVEAGQTPRQVAESIGTTPQQIRKWRRLKNKEMLK